MNNDSKKTLAAFAFALVIACLLCWPLAMNALRTTEPTKVIDDNNKEILLPPGNWPPPLSEEELRKLQEKMRQARAKDGGKK